MLLIQDDELPMGSLLSPALVNIYSEWFEKYLHKKSGNRQSCGCDLWTTHFLSDNNGGTYSSLFWAI